MTNVYYSKDYISAGHAFDTTRKSGLLAEDLQANPLPGVRLVAPRPLTIAELSRVHAPEYVKAVSTGQPLHLAESAGFGWDKGLWQGVRASNGGAVAAAVEALQTKRNAGSLSSGLHHAGYDQGMGFCTFNGLALAAVAARDAGATRVLLIDLDAHCGGGTYSLLKKYPWVDGIDISTSLLDSYRPGNDDVADRWTLDLIQDPQRYLSTLRYRLNELDEQARCYDLVLYNAGMDPEERSCIGGLDGLHQGIIEEREAEVFAWARKNQTPVAFVLAGGYSGADLTPAELTKLHRMTVAGAAGAL